MGESVGREKIQASDLVNWMKQVDMNEQVSICIPAYNNEKDIKKTIESLLAQTYKKIEIIVVDDASTDYTCDIVRGFEDDRIHLYQNESNLGMACNWNRCVELANSEYVKLICADDVLLPESIETELNAIASDPEVVMTINDSIMINRKGKKLGIFGRYPQKGVMDGRQLARKSLVYNNYFGMPCAVMFRKSIFQKAGGFDSSFQYILDFDLWLSMAPFGKVDVLKHKLNYFMLIEDSNTGKVMTKEKKPYYAEHVYLINKHADYLQVGKCSRFLSKVLRKGRSAAYGIWLKWVLR